LLAEEQKQGELSPLEGELSQLEGELSQLEGELSQLARAGVYGTVFG
jgi:hypothetical protein